MIYGRIDNTTHEGWLLKEGHIDKKWKKRYVILKGFFYLSFFLH